MRVGAAGSCTQRKRSDAATYVAHFHELAEAQDDEELCDVPIASAEAQERRGGVRMVRAHNVVPSSTSLQSRPVSSLHSSASALHSG